MKKMSMVCAMVLCLTATGLFASRTADAPPCFEGWPEDRAEHAREDFKDAGEPREHPERKTAPNPAPGISIFPDLPEFTGYSPVLFTLLGVEHLEGTVTWVYGTRRYEGNPVYITPDFDGRPGTITATFTPTRRNGADPVVNPPGMDASSEKEAKRLQEEFKNVGTCLKKLLWSAIYIFKEKFDVSDGIMQAAREDIIQESLTTGDREEVNKEDIN